MEAIRIVEAGDLKKDRGGFKPGDTVKVMVKVVEGEKGRLQGFGGGVVRRRGAAQGEAGHRGADLGRAVELSRGRGGRRSLSVRARRVAAGGEPSRRGRR